MPVHRTSEAAVFAWVVRRFLTAGLSLLLGGSASKPPSPLAGVKSWVVYYGGARQVAADLARFDLVILDPGAHPPLEIVKRNGALVLMYVSLGEVNVHHPHYASVAAEPWVLGHNPNWPEERFLDVRAPAYERWLLDRLVPAALAGPVDGIFLDTADSALELERAEPQRFRGAAGSLERTLLALRQAHPRALIVLNSGLPLAERLGRVLDGVAVESVWTDYDFSQKAYRPRAPDDARQRAAEFRRLASLGLPVLTLEYAPPEDEAWVRGLIRSARANGFVPYVSTIDLQQVFTHTLSR